MRTPTWRRPAVVLLVGVMLAAVSGCESDPRLVGTWIPTDYPESPRFDNAIDQGAINPQASVTFASDGKWTASDGCNDLAGDYGLGSGSDFDATSGSFAGVGCGGFVPWDRIFSYADHVEIQDGSATITDDSGTVLIVLEKAE